MPETGGHDVASRTSSPRSVRAGATALALVCGLVALPSLVRLPQVDDALHDAGLVRREARFVELAFPGEEEVADFTGPRGRTTVSFTITNRLGAARRLTWDADLVGADGDGRGLARGAVALADGETVEQGFSRQLTCLARQTVRVRVTAPGSTQPTVQFFVLPLGGPSQPGGRGPYCTSDPSEAS